MLAQTNSKACQPVARPQVLHCPVLRLSLVQHGQQQRVHAKRRELARDYSFVEIYGVVMEKLQERNCLLVKDTYQLIECIKTPEHAARCLDIIQKFLARQQATLQGEDELQGSSGAGPSMQGDGHELGPFLADWHHRKRFLTRISEIAVMELGRPDLLFAIVGNWQRFKLSTYFGKDIIKHLGKYDNVPLEVLQQVAALVSRQLGPSHKGTKAALMALLEVMQDRGVATESLDQVKKALAEARRTQQQPADPVVLGNNTQAVEASMAKAAAMA